MAGSTKQTTNRGVIRKWVEERGGRPVVLRTRSRGEYDAAPPRINFPEYHGSGFQTISWDQFFRKFDERQLVFVYQETMETGEMSRFFKFVSRVPARSNGSNGV